MRVEVDYDSCQSLGVCESLAPQVFEVRTDGIMYILERDVAAAGQVDVRDAVAACPSFALRLVDEEAGAGSSSEQP